MHVSLTVSCKESKMSLGVMSRTFSTAPWQHSTAFFTYIVQVRELDLYWAEQETWVWLYCHRDNLRVQQGAVAEERDNSVRHDRLFSFISLRYCRGQRQCRKDIVCVYVCVCDDTPLYRQDRTQISVENNASYEASALLCICIKLHH